VFQIAGTDHQLLHLDGDTKFGVLSSQFWCNKAEFSDISVTVMSSAPPNKQGTITTKDTAAYHCHIFTVKWPLVEWVGKVLFTDILRQKCACLP
jgi:hypothetical protein